LVHPLWEAPVLDWVSLPAVADAVALAFSVEQHNELHAAVAAVADIENVPVVELHIQAEAAIKPPSQ
jgi:hypothetical protein